MSLVNQCSPTNLRCMHIFKCFRLILEETTTAFPKWNPCHLHEKRENKINVCKKKKHPENYRLVLGYKVLGDWVLFIMKLIFWNSLFLIHCRTSWDNFTSMECVIYDSPSFTTFFLAVNRTLQIFFRIYHSTNVLSMW